MVPQFPQQRVSPPPGSSDVETGGLRFVHLFRGEEADILAAESIEVEE